MVAHVAVEVLRDADWVTRHAEYRQLPTRIADRVPELKGPDELVTMITLASTLHANKN